MQTNNPWIFSRKALVAFAIAVISALATLVGTLNNTAQIKTLKDQNVRIEQQVKHDIHATNTATSPQLHAAKQAAVKASEHADEMEQKAALLQKDNELLKRQVPNADK